MDLDVQRDDERRRFWADVEGQEAEITFEAYRDGTLDIMHTYVPPGLRGQGVAEALVQGALEQVQRRGERVVPSCPFVSSYIDRHPEYRRLVAEA